MSAAALAPPPRSAPKLWRPRRVLVTPAALEHPHGRRIVERCEALGLPVEHLPANRRTGLRGEDGRDTYRRAKSTLAVVVSPPSSAACSPSRRVQTGSSTSPAAVPPTASTARPRSSRWTRTAALPAVRVLYFT